MSSIYYPFFQIDYNNTRTNKKSYDHKLYIKLLLLFSTDILIPARTLLTISDEKFNVLLKHEQLIKDGAIYYRLPEEVESLHEYYNNIKYELGAHNETVITNRIEKIIALTKQHKMYSVQEQQTYFVDKIKEFVETYVNERHNVKNGSILCAEIKSITNKYTLDALLKKLKNDDVITKTVYSHIKKASNIIYFISGATSSNLKICSNSFFENSKIEKELKLIIADYDEFINESYNPENIMETLKQIGIIKNLNDIIKLTDSDIAGLRGTSYFEKFAKKFCTLSCRNEAIGYIKRLEKNLSFVAVARELIIAIVLMIISTGITTIFNSSITLTLFLGAIFSVVTTAVVHIFNKYIIKLNFLNKCIDRIIALFVPESVYLYNLKQYINSKHN